MTAKERRDEDRAKTARKLAQRWRGRAANVRRYDGNRDYAGVCENRANRYETLAERLEAEEARRESA